MLHLGGGWSVELVKQAEEFDPEDPPCVKLKFDFDHNLISIMFCTYVMQVSYVTYVTYHNKTKCIFSQTMMFFGGGFLNQVVLLNCFYT